MPQLLRWTDTLCKLQEGGVYQEAIASTEPVKRQGYNVNKGSYTVELEALWIYVWIAVNPSGFSAF